MAVPFDTHAVITKLRQSGFAAEQAEALSDALKMAHEGSVEALATKYDLQALRQDMQHDLQALRQDMQHDLQALELRLDNKIEGLRGTMEARFAELQGKISLLNWMFGALLAAMIPIFVRVVFKV
jgi:DNA anti-recombination protein RmuC